MQTIGNGFLRQTVCCRRFDGNIGLNSSLFITPCRNRNNLNDRNTCIINIVGNDHTRPDFAGFSQGLAENDFSIELKAGDLEALRDSLLKKREFLLRLLENPNLLEHDSFSSLLLAVFHLTEELAQRTDLSRLTAPDRHHLAGDVQRGYVLLIKEWLAYMSHLKTSYPYLFSLALRTNPFDPFAAPEIQ